MSKAALKKAIKDMEKDSLGEIILELYESRPEAKEYLEFWLNPDAESELQKYRKKVFKIFFISEGKPRKSPSLAELKKLTKYFQSLGVESEKNADLMLYTLETFCNWLSLRRHVVSKKPTFDKMAAEVSAYLESAAIEDLFAIRLERVKELAQTIFDQGEELRRRRWRWRW
ncbi:MAG: hypothetical protein K2M93_02885 [Muribaculaceae bacterium]|nr:hypothetical protein [Muribaculaceae bacterium]